MRVEFLRGEDNPQRAMVATPEGENKWAEVLCFEKPFLSFGQEYRHVESVEIGWDGYDAAMCAIYKRVSDGNHYAIPWHIDGSGYYDYSESGTLIPVGRKEMVRTVWETPWGAL